MSSRVNPAPFSRFGGGAVASAGYSAVPVKPVTNGIPQMGDARQNIIENRKSFFSQQQRVGQNIETQTSFTGRPIFDSGSTTVPVQKPVRDLPNGPAYTDRSQHIVVRVTADARRVAVASPPLPSSQLPASSETYFQRHLRSNAASSSRASSTVAVSALSDDLARKAVVSDYCFTSDQLRYARAYKAGDMLDVYPSFVMDPTCIFVVDDPQELLPENLVRMAEEMKNAAAGSGKKPLTRIPAEDMIVAAYCAKYQEWGRGQIIDPLSDNSAHVLFFDYGNAEVVTLANMLPMTAEWMKVPRMTLPVDLEDLEPASLGILLSKTFSKAEITQARKSLTNRFITLEIRQVLPQVFVGRIHGEPRSADEPRTM